jgi:hypothetical protein
LRPGSWSNIGFETERAVRKTSVGRKDKTSAATLGVSPKWVSHHSAANLEPAHCNPISTNGGYLPQALVGYISCSGRLRTLNRVRQPRLRSTRSALLLHRLRAVVVGSHPVHYSIKHLQNPFGPFRCAAVHALNPRCFIEPWMARLETASTRRCQVMPVFSLPPVHLRLGNDSKLSPSTQSRRNPSTQPFTTPFQRTSFTPIYSLGLKPKVCGYTPTRFGSPHHPIRVVTLD